MPEKGVGVAQVAVLQMSWTGTLLRKSVEGDQRGQRHLFQGIAQSNDLHKPFGETLGRKFSGSKRQTKTNKRWSLLGKFVLSIYNKKAVLMSKVCKSHSVSSTGFGKKN